MGEESDQLRRDIEQTCQELSTDVDALTEKVSPKRVVGRRVNQAEDTVSRLEEKVMGTTSDAISSAVSSVRDAEIVSLGAHGDRTSPRRLPREPARATAGSWCG